MSVTYSGTCSIFRSTNFDRVAFRKLGITSGDTEDEFSSSVDLSKPVLPLFPILVPTAGVTTIKFLVIVVTGGQANLRLTKAGTVNNDLDITVQGTIVMSGVELTQVVILGVASGKPFVEIFGAGS